MSLRSGLALAALLMAAPASALSLRPNKASHKARVRAAPPPRVEPKTTHYEIEELLVNGQAPRAGSVEIHERTELAPESLVRQPDTFREEIGRELR